MKKRFLIVLLAIVCAMCLALGLTACDEVSDGTTGGEQNNEQTDGEAECNHVAGEAVIENTVEATCTAEGSYDSVIYCTVCEEELSRTTVVTDKKAHTEGTAVIENTVEATCTAEGSYDSVIYCTVCEGEISRTSVVTDKKAHTEGTAVIENTVESTCAKAGSYDSVIYCTVCEGEISRTTVVTDKKAHTEGTAVIENTVESTCAKAGSYDSVIYCTVCQEELSRTSVATAKKAHTKGSSVVENRVEATCAKEGSYDSVVYCTVCKEQLSRTTVVIDKKEHTEGTPVKENEIAASLCTDEGSYDMVVYCTVCQTELNRESVTVAAKDHSWDSGKVTLEATTTSAGVKTYTCTECGATKTSSVAVLNGGGNALSPSEYAAKFVSALNSDYGLSDRTSVNASGWSVASSYYTYLAKTISTSKYDYSQSSSLSYTSGTEIGIAIGYNSYYSGAFFSAEGSYVISDQITLPGGYVASSSSIKPAFYAVQQALGVSFVDNYTGRTTSVNLDSTNSNSLVATGAWGTTVDVATTDLSVAVSEAETNGNILNLADYLDDMPNFKKYLEDNPVVYLSLLQSGISTADGSGAAIYIAPYSDYSEDVLRYCIIRQDWVIELLDNELVYDGDTYAAACASSTSVSGGWMGVVGSYSIESSTEDGSGDTFIIIKNYDAAKNAVTTSGTALYEAYVAITGGTEYAGTSGNIVDIMNAAIAVNNGATGKQLATLYRAYIDAAYQDENGNAAYTTRSNLFNGYSAAWDVDDLVAMLRIVKTNSANVGLESCSTTGIFPRDASNDRTPDMVRLAAQLYGERGAESDYEYTYIDSNGDLQDARANTSFYQALENFGELASEGLVYNYYNDGSYKLLSSTSLKGNGSYAGTGFMMYDYTQTQATQMYDTMLDSFGEAYAFGAISTPVSKWDVDGDGTKEEIMRFTESCTAVKTAGLAVAASVANDSNKLAAVLTFIDYLYSNDGQIIMSYGIQSTNGNTNPNGTWYGNYVGSAVNSEYCELIGGQWVVKEEYESMYFAFNNELYTGYLYRGKMTPIITDELYEDFLSKTSETYSVFHARGSYTSYTRYVLGLSLPVGVCDRSLETQLCATVQEQSVARVGVSFANGTIKQLSMSIDKDNLWYTCVPAALPLTSLQSEALTETSQSALRGFTGTNMASSKAFYSIFHHIIWKGYTETYSQQGYSFNFDSLS